MESARMPVLFAVALKVTAIIMLAFVYFLTYSSCTLHYVCAAVNSALLTRLVFILKHIFKD